MVKIHTSKNPANMLTKVVPTAMFKVFLDMVGMVVSEKA